MKRLITIQAVQDQIGLKKSSIYKRIQEGTFPPPIKIGRSSRWATDDVEAWIESVCSHNAPNPHSWSRPDSDKAPGNAKR